jgi:hypothetical protein
MLAEVIRLKINKNHYITLVIQQLKGASFEFGPRRRQRGFFFFPLFYSHQAKAGKVPRKRYDRSQSIPDREFNLLTIHMQRAVLQTPSN